MTLRPPEVMRLLVEDTALDAESNSIRIGTPVLGSQWYEMANAVNWLQAHGGTLVAGCANVMAVAGSAVSYVFYNCSTSLSDQQARIWVVQMASTTFSQGTVTLDETGTSYTWASKRLPTDSLADQIYIFTEIANSTPGESIGITIEDTAAQNTLVTSISCYEVPLFLLQEGDGVHESTVRSGFPIWNGGNDDKSVEGVYDQFVVASNTASKRCMFSWCNPNGITVTTTTFTGTSNLFRIDPAVSARHARSDFPQRPVTVAVYAVVTGTSPSGEVYFEATSGGNATLSVVDTSAVYAWYSTTMYVDTDDPTRYATDGGIRGGTRDEILVELRVTGGDDITVKSVFIGNG